MQEKNGGAHWALLDAVIKRNKGAYATGESPTIADAALFCLIQIALPVFEEKLTAAYPDLLAYYKRIAKLPTLQAYLNA